MPFTHHFKPAHKEIKRYYEDLAGYTTHEVVHEGATRTAFANLLAATCKKADWHLVPELSTRICGKQVRPDGTLRDNFNPGNRFLQVCERRAVAATRWLCLPS